MANEQLIGQTVYVLMVIDPNPSGDMSYTAVYASAEGAAEKAAAQVTEWRNGDAGPEDYTPGDLEEDAEEIPEATAENWDGVLFELKHRSLIEDGAQIEISEIEVQP